MKAVKLQPVAIVLGACVVAVALVIGTIYLVNGADKADSANAQAERKTSGKSTSPEAASSLQEIRHETLETYGESLEDSWVVQLSSKNIGVDEDGVEWTEHDILEHYEEIKAKHSNAIILWSGDWSSYSTDDYWRIVLSETFDSGGAALEWCDSSAYGPDDCIAKLLSKTSGPDGTELYQESKTDTKEPSQEALSGPYSHIGDMELEDAMRELADAIGGCDDTYGLSGTKGEEFSFVCETELPSGDPVDVDVFFAYDTDDDGDSERTEEWVYNQKNPSYLPGESPNVSCDIDHNVAICLDSSEGAPHGPDMDPGVNPFDN